jgi:transcriptional regulator with XRE-family HTH domain
MTNTFGSLLRQNRSQLKLTQAELGQKLGMTKSAVCKMESGVKRPTPKTIEQLALIFGMDAIELYAAAGYPPAGRSVDDVKRWVELMGVRSESQNRN